MTTTNDRRERVSDEVLADMALNIWAGAGPTPQPDDFRANAPKRWTEAQAKEIEARHGHDPRLKCYPEFGCQAIEYQAGLVAAELVSLRGQLEAATEPTDEQIEKVAQALIGHYSLIVKNHVPDDDDMWRRDARRILRVAGGAR